MLLGDLGAEVIKIERPGMGDDTRHLGPPFINEESAYFLAVNRNKKSLALNLKHPKGIEVVKKLVATSDVVVENYVPGKLDELGLGYDTLRKRNPALIYCSVTGYGQTGPYSRRAGYDVIAAGMGGLLNITGPENGEPCKPGVALTDLSTGLFAKSAILAALLQRGKTGEGQHIDANLLATQVALLTYQASNYLIGGMEGRRLGTEHPNIVPYKAFRTSDGFLVIGATFHAQFVKLCERIELPDLAQDDRFKTNAGRVKYRDVLMPQLSERLAQKTTSEWLDVFEGCGFPYGPINNMEQLFSDPHVLHTELVQEIEHPVAGKIRVTGHPVKYSNASTDIRMPSPTLGQHTAEILSNDLGYSQAEIENLHKEEAIGLPQ